LNAAQLSEFIDFYKKFYVPNNATLSIAGDFDPAQAKVWISKYFADIPGGLPVVQPKVEDPLLASVEDTIYDNIQIPAIFTGYRMPGETHPDAYAMQMLTQVLSSGKSSRLTKRMVDEDRTALQVSAFPFALEQNGVFIALALANGDATTGGMKKTIEEEIAKLQSELISENEFAKVLNKIEADFVTSNGSVAGIAESLANYHVYYGDANLINTEIDRYRKVTREDIRRVAQTYLTPSNRVVLHYLPKPTAQSIVE
jgi:predicted Zn-dependent peptidase